MNRKVRIVLGFAIVFLVSFIPELVPDLFGDWECQGGTINIEAYKNQIYTVDGCNYGHRGEHEPTLHYGFRHWVWIFCGLTLFVWNIIDVFEDSSK